MECLVTRSNTGCTHILAENGYGTGRRGAPGDALAVVAVTVPGYTRDLFCRVIHSTGKGLADFRAVGGEGRPLPVRECRVFPGSPVWRCASVPRRPWGILTAVKRYQHRGSAPAGDLSLRAEPLKTGCEGFARSCGGGRAAWIEEGLCLSR